MLSAFLAPGQGLSKNHNLERCMPSARREDGEVVRGLAVGGLHGDLLGLEDLVGRRDADPDLVDVRRAELERERRRVRAALARGPGAVGRRLEVDVDPARDALGPRAAALAEHHEGDVEAVREASMPSVVSQSVGASAQPSTPISWAWPAQATRLLGRAPRWSWVSDAQPSWGVTDAALVRVSAQ